MDLWLQIGSAALMLIMIWRLWPVAKHYMTDGPKGNSQDWMKVIVPLAAVVGFVLLLIMMVRA